MIVPAIVHFKWTKNVIPQRLLVGLPGDLLDDRPQDEVAGIVIPELTARFEFQISAAILLNKFFDLIGIPADVFREVRQAGIAGDPRGMGQQLMDGDL